MHSTSIVCSPVHYPSSQRILVSQSSGLAAAVHWLSHRGSTRQPRFAGSRTLYTLLTQALSQQHLGQPRILLPPLSHSTYPRLPRRAPHQSVNPLRRSHQQQLSREVILSLVQQQHRSLQWRSLGPWGGWG